VLALHALGESDAESIGKGACLFVPGGRLCGDDDRAQVAEVDFSEPCFGGLGAVPPICGMESGEQTLAEGEEDLGGNLWLAGTPGRFVLPVDLRTEAGNATVEEDPSDEALFGGKCIDGGLPMDPSWTQAGSPGASGWIGRVSSARALLGTTSSALAAGLAFGAFPAPLAVPGRLTPALAAGLAFGAFPAPLAVPGTLTPTRSAFALMVVVATAPTTDQACGHLGFLVTTVEELEEYGAATHVPGRQDSRDGHSIEVLVDLHPQDVTYGDRPFE